MTQKNEIRMNIRVDADTHWVLKVWCAQERLTLQEGVVSILRQRLKGLRARVAAPPWEGGSSISAVPVQVEPGMDIIGEALPSDELGASPDDINASKVFPGRVYPPPTRATAGLDLIDDEEERGEPQSEAVLSADPAAWDAAFLTRAVDAKTLRAANGHSRNEEAARAGPITSKEFEVPPTWVARDGVTRAENLKRYGEDEDIEYWPPVKAAHLDVDAPIKTEEDL